MLDFFLLLLSICRPARILRWAAFLLAVCLGWLMLENSTLQAYLEERDRRNTYRDRVEELQQQQKQYEAELADLKAGGSRLEKAVRERLPMIKPGEKILRIKRPGDPEPERSEPLDLDPALLEESAPKPDQPTDRAAAAKPSTAKKAEGAAAPKASSTTKRKTSSKKSRTRS